MEENRKQESIYNKTLEKGKGKEQSKEDLEELVFTTGGLRVPVINSPADIYKHFPRKVTFQEELRERLIAKQKLQLQKKLEAEKTLATPTTNSETTTLYDRLLTLRKQVPAFAEKLLEKC